MVDRSVDSSSAPITSAHAAPSGRIGQGGLLPPIPFDMMRFRAVFPDRWSGLLRAHFPTAYQVEIFFGVDSKTARDWWHGKKAPSGPFVARALSVLPGAMAELMEAA